ncbi:agmatine deiminase [Alkalibacterium subtropicum]|uniref:Putative agmatine deiminase n=1 Tax=Alkalibacterium subtropicum TaxID=753702 RepID=A0A1I1IIX2_9LACT|nr:agmatine deiminase [Alkalibacterium subtropicum]SFC33160.1 agmatine deiminase [Alkalibacterium subtropicum]
MVKRLSGTPKKEGFRMPGEFEPHAGCWMIWPERTDNWRLGGKPAQRVFAEVANTIVEYEKVTMCVSPSQFENARDMLKEHVRVVEMSVNDSWMRDSGPTFVKNKDGEVRGVDWRFNAWGGLVDGLYFPWDKDDQVARKVCEIENIDYYSLEDFILEGGSIHTDGEGTVIVTEECLLHESRNPKLDKEEIETKLKEYLGAEKVLWIPEGIYLDETNGHVDNIIHYCAPGVIVLAWTDDEEDPQYPRSKRALDYLSNETDARGRKLVVHKLHIPHEVLITKEESEGVDKIDGTLPRQEGDRQAASYANFYIANDAVILPLFNDEKYDQNAKDVLSEVFPDREVRGIYAREILLGGGNIHCITQQQPLAEDINE